MIERVARFLDDPRSAAFEELALAAFAFQFERIEPYRRLCASRGASPANVASWREVPLVPAAAFKSLRLAAAPEREVFRSSGTSQGEAVRSVHHHPFPELYRQTIDASFPRFCLPHGGRPAMLSLIPSREQEPESSLSFMVEHILTRYGGADSVTAFGRRGVEAAVARSWAAARQRQGLPVLILATSFALAQWLESLARLGLRFRLPAGSAVFETGGFKGRGRELARDELLAALGERLDVAPAAVVREYGMTELTSQCYTRGLLDGDPDLYVAPDWVRVRVLDPSTLAESAPGRPGLLAVFDLANVGSAVHLLTEDLAVAEGDGFRLLGRAAGAELRGCSLVVEELLRPA